ncbi:nad-dependent protein deacetylase sirtuin-2 [Anaeramoeba flamelloides]|uniref:Nad-dependent protein deacetylase sirtuin-2 n=1 Tax=Anaeramoeba flamelloides TaxID=1746091 RepID=A0ABQ8YLZ8_9EUKA|nr:nad-dependent protein deacetylase sirtuin-2 [Anaeramoeba flamelloides]
MQELEKNIESLSLNKAPTFESIAKGLKNNDYQNIIVMNGAGISVGAGLSDFRSPKTGFFEKMKKLNLPSPESVFTISYFLKDPKPFYSIAREFIPSLLLRVYTQNVDTLERKTGLSPEKLVEAHGSFATATCLNCGKKYIDEDIKSDIIEGNVPKCSKCNDGVIKPDITFYGEELPSRFNLVEKDFPKADLLIVIGTSLKVMPFNSLIRKVKDSCPRVLINLEEVAVHGTGSWTSFSSKGFQFNENGNIRDVKKIGNCQKSIQEIIKICGWVDEFKKLSREERSVTKTINENEK